MAILGEDAVRTSETLIEARRQRRQTEESWFRRLVGDTGQKRLVRLLKDRTLTEFEQAGFLPQDLVENGLDISILSRFTPTELHAHGFTWDILVDLGIGGGQLRLFTWREINLFNLRKDQIYALSVSAHDILSIGLTVQQLHTLGFTRQNLQERGATPEQLEEIFGQEDVRMYLGGERLRVASPTPPQTSVTFTF